MNEREQQIPEVIDNLRRIFHSINEYSKAAEQITGLTGPQSWALSILARETPIKISDLATRMFLRPATVVGIIDRLENKGLVTRNRSKVDRRSVDLQLTAAGKEIVTITPEVAQVVLVKGLGALSDSQLECVVEGMQQMVKILGVEQTIPQPLH